MTEPGAQFYSIEKLLTQTVQPFPDLPAEDFEILKQSIKDRGLLNHILLTSDGYLFDGHQRCKALLALGRKRISADQVEVKTDVTRENMLGAAFASNMVRRMISSADKAARMHACAAMGWGQRKIAREFHMSQPGVSQLMAAYPPEGEVAPVLITEGDDGKTYTRPSKTPKAKPHPWAHNGKYTKQLGEMFAMLNTGPPTEVTPERRADIVEHLAALGRRIETWVADVSSIDEPGDEDDEA